MTRSARSPDGACDRSAGSALRHPRGSASTRSTPARARCGANQSPSPCSGLWFSAPSDHALLASSWSSQTTMKGCWRWTACESGSVLYWAWRCAVVGEADDLRVGLRDRGRAAVAVAIVRRTRRCSRPGGEPRRGRPAGDGRVGVEISRTDSSSTTPRRGGRATRAAGRSVRPMGERAPPPRSGSSTCVPGGGRARPP